ncbi:Uncharacterized protein PCOAH_00026310 [Plasmodium coatneyi]|uniref:Uncharacterized protein n=1 Tax=Plasmodium coatneyi TaxID=208452 RepID=A0A1B1DZV3_9APIC|nr:Uncharacterized protein PCOAH_00026310 [Plasmodium coatneyi]ANQ08308.1 Uncharacterized protein PCOAH_00026310 [Plasmodium coatneyi]
MGSPHVRETHTKSSIKRAEKKKDARGERETKTVMRQFVLPEGGNYFPNDELHKSANLSSRGCTGEESLKEEATTRPSDRVKGTHLSDFFKKGRNKKINTTNCANVKKTPRGKNFSTSQRWEVHVGGQAESECLNEHFVRRDDPIQPFDEGCTPFGDPNKRERSANGRHHLRESILRDSPPTGKKKHIFCENLFYGQPTQGGNKNGKEEENSFPLQKVRSLNGGLTNHGETERHPSIKEKNNTPAYITNAKRISSVKLKNQSSDELTGVSDEVPNWERTGTQRNGSVHVKFDPPEVQTNGDSPKRDDRNTPHGEGKHKFSLNHFYNNYLRNRSKWSLQLARKNALVRAGSRGSGGPLNNEVSTPTRRPPSRLRNSENGLSTIRTDDRTDRSPTKAANRNIRFKKNKLVKLFLEGNNVYVENLKVCPREERKKHVLSNWKSAKITERPILSLPNEPIPLSDLESHKYKVTNNLHVPRVRTEKEDIHFLKFKNTWYELLFYTSSGGSRSRESLYNHMLMRLNFELLVQPIKDIVLVDQNTLSFSYPYIYNAYLVPPLDVHDTGNSLRIQKATSDHALINNGSWVFFKKEEKGKGHRKKMERGTPTGGGVNGVNGNGITDRPANYLINMRRNRYFVDKCSFRCAKKSYLVSLKSAPSSPVDLTKGGIDPPLFEQPTGGITLSRDITTEKVRKAKTLPIGGKSLEDVVPISGAKQNYRRNAHTNGRQVGNLIKRDSLKRGTTVKDDTTTEKSNIGQGNVSPPSNSLFDCSCVYMTHVNSNIEPVFPYTCKNIFFLFQYYHNYLNGVIRYFREDKVGRGLLRAHRKGETLPPPVPPLISSLTSPLTSSPTSPNGQGSKTANIPNVNNFKIRNLINAKLYDSVFSYVKKKNLEKVKAYNTEGGRRRSPQVPIFLWVIFGGKDMKSIDSLNTVYKILRYATEIPPSEYMRYVAKLERRKIKKNLHTKWSKKKEGACPDGEEQRKGTPKRGIPPEQEYDSANEFFPNLATQRRVNGPSETNSGSPTKRGGKEKKKLPQLPSNIFFHKNLYKNATEIYDRIVTYYEQYNEKCDAFGPDNYGNFLDYYRERVRGSTGDSEGEDAQRGGDPHGGGHLGNNPHETNNNEDDAYDFFIERSDSEGDDKDELFDFISYHMQGRNPSFEKSGAEVKEGKLNYTDIYGPLIYKKRNKKNPVRYSFLLLDYPAYNNSTGHPSPLTFKTSALAALKEALKELRRGDHPNAERGNKGEGDDDSISSVCEGNGNTRVDDYSSNSNVGVSINILGYSLGCCVGLQLLLDIAKSLYNDFFQGESKTPFHRKEREPIREPPNEGNDLSIKLNSRRNNKVNEYVYDARKILTFGDVFVSRRSSSAIDPEASIEREEEKDDLKDQKVRKYPPCKTHSYAELHQRRSSNYCCSVTNYQQRNKLKVEIHKNEVCKNASCKNAGCKNVPKKIRINESLQSVKQRKKEAEKMLCNELNITVDRVILVAPFTNTQKLVKSILRNSVLFLLSWFVMNKKCPYVHWDNISVLKEFLKILYDLKGTKHLSSIFANLQIYFIHGEKDTLVNYQMSLKLYKLTNTLTSKYALHHVKSFLYIFKEDCHSSIFNTEGENKILQIIFKPLRLHPFSTTNIHKLHFSLYRDIYLLKTAYLQYISAVTSKLLRA